jgi:hypothetical protein
MTQHCLEVLVRPLFNPVRDMTRPCAHQSTLDSSHHSPEDMHSESGQLQNMRKSSTVMSSFFLSWVCNFVGLDAKGLFIILRVDSTPFLLIPASLSLRHG